MTRLDIGYEFDRYRVESVLGQGGAATVYAVRHLRLDSLQALKVMHVTTASFQHRLLQEGRGQAGLRHPNVVSVFDVLDIDGAPALLMEYVGGPTLGSFLKTSRCTVSEALWLFRGIVLGVGAAHRRGMVHRDLKPDNVLLAPTNDGLVPKVTDFGLVKMAKSSLSPSQLGRAVGTAPYMAPEQVSGSAEIEQPADMWALGCILYELVTGQRAFRGVNTLDTFNKVRSADYAHVRTVVPDVPAAVADAIGRMLTPDPSGRLANIDHLFELLFDGQLDMQRVDLPADSATPIAPMQLSDDRAAEVEESQNTTVTLIATPPPSPTPRARIAPLGPDPSDDRAPPARIPVEQPLILRNSNFLLKWSGGTPIASSLVVMMAIVAISLFLLSRGIAATHTMQAAPSHHPSPSPSGDLP